MCNELLIYIYLISSTIKKSLLRIKDETFFCKFFGLMKETEKN